MLRGILEKAVVVGKNKKQYGSRVDPGPSRSCLECLPAVAVTPYPVKSGKGIARGSNNQFAILSDETNLVSSIVDVNPAIGACGDPAIDVFVSASDALGVSVDIDIVSVGLSVDAGIAATITQAVDHLVNVLGVSSDSSLDVVPVAGSEGPVVEETVNASSFAGGQGVGVGADGYGKDPVLSPRKTRNATLGVAQLIQEMKARKKGHREKGRKKAHFGLVVVSSQPP
ncbi:hypothetical protein V6N12_068737 [Hibiscus sabdariffa]|uniref:Uncharacterized protein n=1 Tax=Hibiscus sabdariffa TaxID=183260 RepID=A0ABR2FRB5_9ROSI